MFRSTRLARHPRNETSKDEITEQLKPVVIVGAVPESPFTARIKEYATTAEPITRTFAVTLNFDPVDEVTVLPGMTARVKVVVDPERAWSVPSTAVQEDQKGPYVWKVDPDKMTVHKAYVALAEGMAEDRVRLTEGIQKGDLVAISGIAQFGEYGEGMKVRKFESVKR